MEPRPKLTLSNLNKPKSKLTYDKDRHFFCFQGLSKPLISTSDTIFVVTITVRILLNVTIANILQKYITSNAVSWKRFVCHHLRQSDIS